jgi:phosphatidate cytidylyltransferase
MTDDHRGFRPPDGEEGGGEPNERPPLFADVPDIDPDDGPVFSFLREGEEAPPAFTLPEDVEPDTAPPPRPEPTAEQPAIVPDAPPPPPSEAAIAPDPEPAPESEPAAPEVPIVAESGPATEPPPEPPAAEAPVPAEDGPALRLGESAASLQHWTEPPTGELPITPGRPEDTGVLPVLGGDPAPGAPALGGDPGVAFRADDLPSDDLFSGGGRTSLFGDEELDAWSALEQEAPAWRESASDFEGTGPVRIGSAAEPPPATGTFAGSNWQPPRVPEPTEGPGRNLPLAIVTGGAIALLFLGLMAFGSPGAVMVLVTPLVVLAAGEFFAATRRAGYHPAHLFGLVATAGIVLAAFWQGERSLPITLGLVVLFTMAYFLAEPVPSPMANVGITLLGVFWIGFLGSFVALLLRFPNGKGALLAAVIGTVAYDVGGYFVGRTAGQSKLINSPSPNKTYEGLIGGMILALVLVSAMGVVGDGVTPLDDLTDAIAVGAAAAIAAPIGDLSQSLIKRDLGVKDMGTLLPGHGGVLDRFDALLFVLPSVYFVVRALELY